MNNPIQTIGYIYFQCCLPEFKKKRSQKSQSDIPDNELYNKHEINLRRRMGRMNQTYRSTDKENIDTKKHTHTQKKS